MVEQWRGGVVVDKRMKGYSKTFMSSENVGQVDKNLYGGGKYGTDTRQVSKHELKSLF